MAGKQSSGRIIFVSLVQLCGTVREEMSMNMIFPHKISTTSYSWKEGWGRAGGDGGGGGGFGGSGGGGGGGQMSMHDYDFLHIDDVALSRLSNLVEVRTESVCRC